MIRAPGLEPAIAMPPWAVLDTLGCVASPDDPLQTLSAGSAADRFCAWAGRSGRRYIFSVFALCPSSRAAAPQLAARSIALMVRRPATGPRRVLWAERMETKDGMAAVMQAAARHAGPEPSEIHLHVVSIEAEARQAAFADLAFPPLVPVEPESGILRLAG